MLYLVILFLLKKPFFNFLLRFPSEFLQIEIDLSLLDNN